MTVITYGDEFESGLPLTFELQLSAEDEEATIVARLGPFTDFDDKPTHLVVEGETFEGCIGSLRDAVRSKRSLPSTEGAR